MLSGINMLVVDVDACRVSLKGFADVENLARFAAYCVLTLLRFMCVTFTHLSLVTY